MCVIFWASKHDCLQAHCSIAQDNIIMGSGETSDWDAQCFTAKSLETEGKRNSGWFYKNNIIHLFASMHRNTYCFMCALTYTCLKVWGGIRFVYVFERSLLCSPLIFDRKHGNIVTYYYNLKQLFSMRIYFNMYFFSCDAKLNFQHHYSRLQCHMILQKSL